MLLKTFYVTVENANELRTLVNISKGIINFAYLNHLLHLEYYSYPTTIHILNWRMNAFSDYTGRKLNYKNLIKRLISVKANKE